PRIASLFLMSPGVLLIVAALFSDSIGLGGPGGGFGKRRVLCLIGGLLMLAAGLLVGRTRYWRQAVALMIGPCLAFVLLEGALRTHNPRAPRVRGAEIVLRVYQKQVIRNTLTPRLDRTIVVARNELGFRGPSRPRHFDESLTLVTVGGSTTECAYLSDGKTWPDRLMAFLKHRAGTDSVWVGNAGLDGHSTFGHIILMRDYLIKLRPKYVIFLVGANDVGRDDLAPGDAYNLKKPGTRGLRHFVTHLETWLLIENLGRIARARSAGLLHSSWRLEQLPLKEKED